MTGLRLLHNDRGSVAAEAALVTPLLILLLLFVVFSGRLASAQLKVNDAAHQAARAATLARTTDHASTAAEATARSALARAGVSCRSLTVCSDVGMLAPGSSVRVTISCRIGLADLGLPVLPGAAEATASASSVVDQWRGTAP